MTGLPSTQKQERPLWLRAFLLTLCIGVIAVLILLGNWQVRRLSWKLTLIEAVETRLASDPIAPPMGAVDFDTHAYLPVTTTGTFDHSQTYLVKALTELDGGFWVMAPLTGPNGTIWVNRGFVPTRLRNGPFDQPEGEQNITALLRLTEPEGTLLEKNDPSTGRWYSRDVDALSAEADLTSNAPYFLDQSSGTSDWPRAGMTHVTFKNSHLSYALTWYGMALLLAGVLVWLIFRKPDENDGEVE